MEYDILDTLNGYNPPDRVIDEQKSIAVDIADAANEITRLRAEIEKLRETLSALNQTIEDMMK